MSGQEKDPNQIPLFPEAPEETSGDFPYGQKQKSLQFEETDSQPPKKASQNTGAPATEKGLSRSKDFDS